MDSNRILASYRKKWNKIALCRMENDLVSEQILRNKFNFSGNLFNLNVKNVTSRNEHSANYLTDKSSSNEKVRYESKNSTKLQEQYETTHRSYKDLKGKSLKSKRFNYNENPTDALRKKLVSTFLNQNEHLSTCNNHSPKVPENLNSFSNILT